MDANRTEAWLREQVANILAEAQRTDAAEDAEHGDRRGDEPPDDLADPTSRAAKIRAALAEIDAERAAAEAARGRATAELAARAETGPPSRGPHPAAVEVAALRRRLDRLIAAQQAKLDAFAAKVAAAETAGECRRGLNKRPTPVDEHSDIVTARARLARAESRAADRARRQAENAAGATTRVNLTDPGSRLMPTRRGWVQGYNVQIAATGDQLIVATRVVQQTGDRGEFVPMMTAAEQAAADCAQASGRTDIVIGVALADAGYASDGNLTTPGRDRLIALGKGSRQHNDALRSPTHGDPPPDASPREAMDHRLRTAEGARLYKRRGAAAPAMREEHPQCVRRGRHSQGSESTRSRSSGASPSRTRRLGWRCPHTVQRCTTCQPLPDFSTSPIGSIGARHSLARSPGQVVDVQRPQAVRAVVAVVPVGVGRHGHRAVCADEAGVLRPPRAAHARGQGTNGSMPTTSTVMSRPLGAW